jgi:hypothetical protein
MPLRNEKEFICFTKNKCVRPAAVSQFHSTNDEVTSYSGLCLLQHSPMPNLSHFSQACVRATQTCAYACSHARVHTHANTLCQQTDTSVNTVTDYRPNCCGFYYQKQYWKILAATFLTTLRPTQPNPMC